MNKFYALIITADMQLKKMWMSNEQALAILKENKEVKIYRQSNDQEAVIVGEEVVWRDIPTVEKF